MTEERMSTKATLPTVTTQQADFILFSRHDLRLLAAGILPRTSTSIVLRRVTGGTEDSKVELAAIERATLTQVVDEAERALREYVVGWDTERALAFEKTLRLWYGGGLTWRKVGRRVHYAPQHCRRLRGLAREYVAERLSALPGTTMADFWDLVSRLGKVAEESRANERRARSEESRAGEVGEDKGVGKKRAD